MNAPSLRERMGGRWALSWQATLSGIVLVVVLTTATGGGLVQWQTTDIPGIFTAAFVAGIAIAIYTYLAHLTVLRNRSRQPVHLVVVLVFHAGIGVLFAVAFLGLVTALGITLEESPVVSIVGYTLAGLWFCLTMTSTLESADRLRRARRSLVDDSVNLEMSELLSARIVSRMESALIAGDAPPLTERNFETLVPLSAWWEASRALRENDEEDLATHLRRSANAVSQSLHPRSVLDALVRIGHLSPLGTALIFAIAFYRPWVGAWGLAIGLGLSVLMATIIGVTLHSLNRLVSTPLTRLSTAVLTTLAITATFTVAAVGWSASLVAVGLYVFCLVASVFFVLLPAAAVSAQIDYAEVNEKIHDRLQSAEDSQRRRARNAAGHISTLAGANSELRIGAMSLQQAATSPDGVGMVSALEWGSAYLDAARIPFDATSVFESIQGAVTPWDGLMAVRVTYLPDRATAEATVAEGCAVVLEEGLALLGSLAGATTVELVAEVATGGSSHASRLELTMDHDGRPLSSKDLPDDARWCVSATGLVASITAATDSDSLTT